MKLQYISDIHLEFDDYAEKFLAGLEHPGDVLILAGDITIKNRVDWIIKMAEQFDDVIYVMGNHEFYGQNLDNTEIKTREQLPDNVHLLQNESVTIKGVQFHGTTLWTNMDKGNALTYLYAGDRSTGLNDFRKIRADGGRSRFSPQRAHTEHNVAMAFLRNNVKEGDVIITHHAPSFQSISSEFKGDKLNGAYASDLSEDILTLNPKFWIHGHLHNTSDYTIGNTQVLCNPRGYCDFELNDSFEGLKYVEYI